MTTKQLILSAVELVKTMAFIFLIAFVIRTFIVQSFRVEGSSMEPNFHNGEFVLVEKLSYLLTAPKRDDVIVLQAPDQRNIDFIKRIIATAGETIEIRDNQVFVNSATLNESYLKNGELTQINGDSTQKFISSLGQNQYFVMGDNRQNSKDSRIIGPIQKSAIIGKVFFVIWPINHFGLLTQPS